MKEKECSKCHEHQIFETDWNILNRHIGVRNYDSNVRSHEVVLQGMMCDNWFHVSSHTRIKVTLPTPVTWSYFSAWCMVLCNPLLVRWPFNQIPPFLDILHISTYNSSVYSYLQVDCIDDTPDPTTEEAA